MTISAVEMNIPSVVSVRVDDETLSVDLSDGRSIAVPCLWFPRLHHAAQNEREQWCVIGDGSGIHWDVIDEDISVKGLLAGRPSGESLESFQRWLEKRKSAKTG
jgi:hypothetical protein